MTLVTQPTPPLRTAGKNVLDKDGAMVCVAFYNSYAEYVALACNSFDALTEANARLLALVQRYASECADCGGKGYVYDGEAITGRGPDDVLPNRISCVECEDIRAALKVTP